MHNQSCSILFKNELFKYQREGETEKGKERERVAELEEEQEKKRGQKERKRFQKPQILQPFSSEKED